MVSEAVIGFAPFHCQAFPISQRRRLRHSQPARALLTDGATIPALKQLKNGDSL